jgi:hypothetical protein
VLIKSSKQNLSRDASDKRTKSPIITLADTNMPVREITRNCKGPVEGVRRFGTKHNQPFSPLQERDGVVKPKHRIIIFNIIFSQKCINFLSLMVVRDIYCGPFEPPGKR